MKNIKYKRLFAYIIDIIIIAVIASIYIDMPLVNPYFDKYIELSQSMMDYIGGTSVLTNDEIIKLQYDFVYYSFYSSLILLVVKFLYFVIFQYFNKGRTIGKVLFRIRIESNRGKLKFYQILLTSLIICNIITGTINLICLRLLDMESFNSISNVINYLELLILLTSVFMIIIRKDNRGLHDIMSNTKVVMYEKEKNNDNRNSK